MGEKKVARGVEVWEMGGDSSEISVCDVYETGGERFWEMAGNKVCEMSSVGLDLAALE